MSCIKRIILIFVTAILILSISIPSGAKSNRYNYPLSGENPPLSYPAEPSNIGNQGSDSVPLSSGMFRDFLPKFSNIDYGFLYEFSSKGYGRSFFYSDLFLPLLQSYNDVFFTQAHYGYSGFSDGSTYEHGAAAYRDDVSVGGGYRILLNEPSLMCFGLNGFWDCQGRRKIVPVWRSNSVPLGAERRGPVGPLILF